MTRMSTRCKVFVVSILAVFICALGSLSYVVFSSNVYPFTKNLTYAAGVDDENSYIVHFYDDADSEQEVAHAWIGISQVADDCYAMKVSIWHETGTIIDSLSLEFITDQLAPPMYFNTSEYADWPPTEFHAPDDDRGLLLDIPDMGYIGEGTVNMDFTIGPYPLPRDNMTLNISLDLHDKGLVKLTKQEAKGSVEIAF